MATLGRIISSGEGKPRLLSRLFTRSVAATFLWISIALAQGQSPDVLQFASTYFSAVEDSGAVDVQIQRTGELRDYGEVKVSAVPGAGNAGTNDFHTLPLFVTFEPGQSNLTVKIELENDALVEGTESFQIVLSDADPFCCQLGANKSADIEIVDNDQGIEFSSSSYSIREDAGALQLTVRRGGDPVNEERSVTLQVHTNWFSFPAAPGVDFTAPSTSVVHFSAGQSNVTFSIPIFNDALVEEEESFGLSLSYSGSDLVLGPQNSVGVAILDNDTGIEFVRSEYQAFEDGGEPSIQLRRLGEPTNAFTVDLVLGGTATVRLDFLLPTNRLAFAAGQTNLELVLPLLDDALVEGMEQIQLQLIGPTAGMPLGRQTNCSIALEDNEIPVNMVDPAFSSVPVGEITLAAIQPDGKFLIVTRENGLRIQRLNRNGSIDPTFSGPVVSGTILTLAMQTDGKILCGGEFNLEIAGISRYSLIRLLTNGTPDTTFAAPIAGGSVRCIEILPDGKILAGGYIYLPNGAAGILRLMPQGARDPFFQVVLNQPEVLAMVLQLDGMVVIGGGFSSVGGQGRQGLARLSATGSLDATFNAGLSANTVVSTLAWHSDDALLVGVSPGRLLRVSRQTGRLDPTFQAQLGTNSVIQSIKVQSDGKILILGNLFDAEHRWGSIARLHSNGAWDSTFYSMAGTQFLAWFEDQVFTVHEGRLVRLFPETLPFSLSFSAVEYGAVEDGTTAHLTVMRGGNSSSTMSVSFRAAGDGLPGVDFAPPFGEINFQPLEVRKDLVLELINDCQVETNEVLEITLTNPPPGTLLSSPDRARLTIIDDELPGSLAAFAPNLEWMATLGGVESTSIALQPDGKIVVGRCGVMARLNSDGSLDPSFAHGASICGSSGYTCKVSKIVLQPDGKILAGGMGSAIRLLLYGAVEPGFFYRAQLLYCWSTGHGGGGCYDVDADVTSILVQPDGKILLGLLADGWGGLLGWYYGWYEGATLHRLRGDFTIDPAFTPGSFENLRGLGVQEDGKIVVGTRWSIQRLHADGTHDTNFHRINFDGGLTSVAALLDDRILITGSFVQVDGQARRGLARLNPDGSLDTNFNAVISVEGFSLVAAQAASILHDGTLLIAGSFADGTTRVVKLHAQGAQIEGFNSGLRFQQGESPGSITSLVEEPMTDTMLVAGSFDNVSGVPRPGLARLVGERSHLRLTQPVILSDGSVRIMTGSHAGQSYVLQRSGDLLNWTHIATHLAQDCTLELKDASPSTETGFYRVVEMK